MIATFEVHPNHYTPGAFSACVVLDWLPTTFDCTHGHHTEAAAEKCLVDVETTWSSYDHGRHNADHVVAIRDDARVVLECYRGDGALKRYSMAKDPVR